MASPLKLALDGRNLTRSISGISRYISESVVALSAENIQIDILHHQSVHPDFIDYLNAQNITFHKTSTRFSFPRYIPTKADVFWGPAHRFPLNFPKNIPAVTTIHDLVWKKFAYTMKKRTYLGEFLFFAQTLKRANKIICVSYSTANDLKQYFPNYANKIDVVYPGAHRPTYQPQHKGKPFALFVGTMEPRKNLNRLIDAFAGMPHKDQLDLVIVGGTGWGNINPEALIKQQKLSDHVRIIMHADDTRINQLYADCRFLVMPSLYEGFGLPLVEAMKYGKPVLTSNTASMPEVAGKAGLLVNPNSTDAITKAMVELATDQELYSHLSSAAIARADEFTWQKTSQYLFRCFQSLKME